MESRTYHSCSVIALAVMLVYIVLNSVFGHYPVLALAAGCFLIKLLLYSISRFMGHFRIALCGSAVLCYGALVFNYFFNSGINGPTLFMFFFAFNLLIIITPGRMRYLWVALHMVIVAALLGIEYRRPDLITSTYANPAWRVIDLYFTYLFTLAFLYFVSHVLRRHYDYEKRLADSRFTSLVEKTRIVAVQQTDLREKDEVLGKIAFIQSHELRAPVSSIMGLIGLLRESEEAHRQECIDMMERAVGELDEKIRMIIRQTEEMRPEP